MKSCAVVYIFLLCTSLVAVTDDVHPVFDRIGPFGGSARSLLVDEKRPSTIYLGTSDGRIYRSGDGGRMWKLLVPGIGRPNFVIDTMVQHPETPDRIYAGAWDLNSKGGGVFESRDGGSSWHELVLDSPAPAVKKIAISRKDPARIAVATLSGVYLTKDEGKGWSISGAFRNVHSIAFDLRNPDFLFAGTWQLGYRSENFGRSWQLVKTGMPPDSDIFTVSPGPQGAIYAGACSGVYRSSDGARSWTRLRVLPNTFVIRSQIVALDPMQPSRVYVGTTEGLYTSADGGKRWSRLTPPEWIIHTIQINPANPEELLIGTEGQGVQRSHDRGFSWEDSNTGFSHRRITRVVSASAQLGGLRAWVFSGSGPGSIVVFDPKSENWKPPKESFPRDCNVFSWMDLPEGSGTLAGTSRGLYRRRSGSQVWEQVAGQISRRQVHDLAFDAETGLLLAGTDYGIYTASANTLNFSLPPGIRYAPKVYSLAISPKPAVLAATSLGILESTDHGRTWRAKPSSGLPSVTGLEFIRAHPSDPGRMFAGTPAGLYESRDGGSTWTACGGLRSTAIPSVLFLGDGQIAAADGTRGGLFFSQDDGLSWRKIEAAGFSSPVRTMTADASDSRLLYLGTAYDGIYRLRLP